MDTKAARKHLHTKMALITMGVDYDLFANKYVDTAKVGGSVSPKEVARLLLKFSKMDNRQLTQVIAECVEQDLQDTLH